jgi:hypothetical protein
LFDDRIMLAPGSSRVIGEFTIEGARRPVRCSTERSTHFLWCQAHRSQSNDSEVSPVATRMLEQALDEDRAVRAEQQRLIAS